MILKTIRDYISKPLAFLVNDSFVSGNFPEKLKLARITPLFLIGLMDAKFYFSQNHQFDHCACCTTVNGAVQYTSIRKRFHL